MRLAVGPSSNLFSCNSFRLWNCYKFSDWLRLLVRCHIFLFIFRPKCKLPCSLGGLMRLLLVSWLTTLLLVELLIVLLDSKKIFVTKRGSNRVVWALICQLRLSHWLRDTFYQRPIKWVQADRWCKLNLLHLFRSADFSLKAHWARFILVYTNVCIIFVTTVRIKFDLVMFISNQCVWWSSDSTAQRNLTIPDFVYWL